MTLSQIKRLRHPVTITLASGESFRVAHPECYLEGETTLAFVAEDREPILCDKRLITSVRPYRGQATKKA